MTIVRDGGKDDAKDLARMISDFNIEEGSPGRLTEAGIHDLCFEERPHFHALVAEDKGELVGYALIMRHFDTEHCAYCSYMQDLYVIRGRRSEGIGRLLVAAAARRTIDLGCLELMWHVRDDNNRGRAFYASIGAEERSPIPVNLSGDALRELAREAEP